MSEGNASIHLREKSVDDRNRWHEVERERYRSELLEAGNSLEAAQANIDRNDAQLWVGDEPVKGQYVFDVIRGDEKVGTLWLGTTPVSDSEWWIYDIEIDEEFRGTGLSRPTLAAAEEFARANGATQLGLNVFGSNAVARHLYETSGFHVKNVLMQKDLA
ncbi:MAG: GNAT family N-acetyltransferase [Acidimicrobiales bacterium]